MISSPNPSINKFFHWRAFTAASLLLLDTLAGGVHEMNEIPIMDCMMATCKLASLLGALVLKSSFVTFLNNGLRLFTSSL